VGIDWAAHGAIFEGAAHAELRGGVIELCGFHKEFARVGDVGDDVIIGFRFID